MRKTLIKIFTLGLSVLILLCVFLLPIYKLDSDFLLDNFEDQIKAIQDEELDAYFEHEFSKESLDKVVTNIENIKIATLSNHAFEVSYHTSNHEYQEKENALEIPGGITFTSRDFPDFVKVAVFVKGEGSSVEIKVNNKTIGKIGLTNNIERYDFQIEGESLDSSIVELIFTGTVILDKIKINEQDRLTYEQAEVEFINRVIAYSGLINTNLKILDMDEATFNSYFTEELNIIKTNGISVINLFNMIIEDVTHNYSVISSANELSIMDKLAYYQENRHCPFFSILTLLCTLGIIGGAAVTIVLFILNSFYKKEYNLLIPSLVTFVSIVILLNMSTFTGLNFFTFKGEHNIVNEYRLLVFESIHLNISFVLAILLSMITVIINLVNIILEFVNNKKRKTSLIVYSSIMGASIILLILSAIIK